VIADPLKHRLFSLLVIFWLCAALSSGGCSLLRTPEPLIVRQILVDTPGGICRGFVCTVDLKSPRIRTAFARDVQMASVDSATEPHTFTVDDWAARVDATIAINAGLSEHLSPTPSNLISRGENIALSAGHAPTDRRARSAIGASNDGRTLILATIDAGDPEWSVGITLPELSHLLITCGATEARTLPGDGATSFVFRPATMFARYTIKPEIISNRPSGNEPAAAVGEDAISASHFPRVPNVIGIFVRPRVSDYSAAPCASGGFD
jgi:hypothetical protein